MSALTFELKGKPDQRLDLSPLTPSRLKDLKAKEIEALAVGTTRVPLTVGDVFKVKGKDAGEIRFTGTDGRCDKIGAGLTEGTIVVEGDAGAYLGAAMKRGKIEVKGSAGVLAGASMAGGSIAISGDTGERAAGILVGETMGMKGGVLTIGGNAGPLIGERMRRGFVIVGGDAGDYAGGRMIAGTILFKRKVGRYAGYGLTPRQPDLRGGAEGPAADLRRLRRARIRLSPAARALAPRDRQACQPWRPRPPAHGRHGRARQGRDADPGLETESQDQDLDVDTSDAHMGYARLPSGCRVIGFRDDRFPLRPSRRQSDAGRQKPALYRA